MKAYLRQEGGNYNAVLPDKITIFKNRLRKRRASKRRFERNSENTVWHEIAHHLE